MQSRFSEGFIADTRYFLTILFLPAICQSADKNDFFQLPPLCWFFLNGH